MTDKITRKDVAYVAKLARLSLSEEEIDTFAEQLSAVLDHAQSLFALDIEGVAPTSHALSLQNVLRPDVVTPSCDRQEVLDEAPATEDRRFKVPRILGEAP